MLTFDGARPVAEYQCWCPRLLNQVVYDYEGVALSFRIYLKIQLLRDDRPILLQLVFVMTFFSNWKRFAAMCTSGRVRPPQDTCEMTYFSLAVRTTNTSRLRLVALDFVQWAVPKFEWEMTNLYLLDPTSQTACFTACILGPFPLHGIWLGDWDNKSRITGSRRRVVWRRRNIISCANLGLKAKCQWMPRRRRWIRTKTCFTPRSVERKRFQVVVVNELRSSYTRSQVRRWRRHPIGRRKTGASPRSKGRSCNNNRTFKGRSTLSDLHVPGISVKLIIWDHSQSSFEIIFSLPFFSNIDAGHGAMCDTAIVRNYRSPESSQMYKCMSSNNIITRVKKAYYRRVGVWYGTLASCSMFGEVSNENSRRKDDVEAMV